jgi:regulatory associated protein of mTOR
VNDNFFRLQIQLIGLGQIFFSDLQHTMWQAWDLAVDMALSQLPGILDNDTPYRASTFFEEQLTAFEVWLKYGNERRPPPEQLPIVLQVLLSQAHRLRALDLLGRFLDLGPWAVNLALSVGIFPYVLKLLQSAARELRPLLVSIWAKILAVDTSCQNDLVRDASHKYFINVLQVLKFFNVSEILKLNNNLCFL